MDNKFLATHLLVVVLLLSAHAMALPGTTAQSERPIIYDPKEMVGIEVHLLNDTDGGAAECHPRNYSVEITNEVFFSVCDLKIRVELPKTATLESVSNLKPVNGTADQFTFPDSLRYLFVSKKLDAQLTVAGEGEPKISVLDAKAAYGPNKCKTSKF